MGTFHGTWMAKHVILVMLALNFTRVAGELILPSSSGAGDCFISSLHFLLIGAFSICSNSVWKSCSLTAQICCKKFDQMAFKLPGRVLTESSSDATVRVDPLNHLKKYRGGFNVTNDHYWSVSISIAIPTMPSNLPYNPSAGLMCIVSSISKNENWQHVDNLHVHVKTERKCLFKDYLVR